MSPRQFEEWSIALNIKKITVFVILTLVFQLTLFSLLNLKTEHLLNAFYRFNKVYSLKTDLTKASDYNLSYNNRYLAFITEESLQILDLTTNKVVFRSEPARGGKLSILGYKWLPDRNSVIYLARNLQDANRPVSLYSLNLDSNVPLEGNGLFEARLDRTLNLTIDKVKSIQVSTYTNNLYILYTNELNQNRLINIDIMKNINRLDNPGESVLEQAVSNKFGTLYVENVREGGKGVYSLKGREWRILSDNPQEILLGCLDKVVYTGKTVKDELREIICYSLDSGTNYSRTGLWQGRLPLLGLKAFISSDNKVFLQNTDRIDIIYPDGTVTTIDSKQSVIVLSPTGKMYMEIDPVAQEYYWRSL